MIEIPLTKGQVAIVCDCCAHKVRSRTWRALWCEDTHSYYATCQATIAERLTGAPATLYMHVVINGTPRGKMTDHKDGDTLNNQCCNLRTVTPAQNQRNRGRNRNNTSGYKGVSFHARNKKWQTSIGVGRGKQFVGYYATAEEAAQAYDVRARELFGKDAVLNFPQETDADA